MGRKRSYLNYGAEPKGTDNVYTHLKQKKKVSEWMFQETGSYYEKHWKSVAGGIFKPCRKCDYPFNYVSGKVQEAWRVKPSVLKKV